MEKTWQGNNRKELLDRLHRRHNSNCGLEIKAGIKKPLYGCCMTESLNQFPGTAEVTGTMKFGFVEPGKSHADNDTINRLKKAKTVTASIYVTFIRTFRRITCTLTAIFAVSYSWIIQMPLKKSETRR